ncbi:DinB family protein [Bremerella sp. JC770]|uniref:DinB family protein n=1 Tax=Bremerella sp. JC770 TaxID=3232137 RepID=UPI00345AD3FD
MADAAQWELTKQRIAFTDKMFREFIEGLEPELWFRMPEEGVTHIAWQVGHITIANYGLGMLRIRGKRAEDAGLIPESYSTNFGRGSVPSNDQTIYPSRERFLEIYKKVNDQLLEELETYTLEQLDKPSLPDHPLFKTKFETLVFLPYHVMMHLGQMGLLRRLSGKAPLR